jgi:3-phenylpropionate/trans-cinnamate dioxygenase ferredoxin subunit
MSTVNLGAFDALVDGAGTCFDLPEGRIAVFRIGDDVYALADRCSHAEASLSDGEVFDAEVECPRHGAAFDLRDGRPLSLPATRPVTTYRAEVVDDDVIVTLEENPDA